MHKNVDEVKRSGYELAGIVNWLNPPAGLDALMATLSAVNWYPLDTEFILGDPLGSVRLSTDQVGAIIFAQGFDPYGAVNCIAGSSGRSYGISNEYQCP